MSKGKPAVGEVSRTPGFHAACRKGVARHITSAELNLGMRHQEGNRSWPRPCLLLKWYACVFRPTKLEFRTFWADSEEECRKLGLRILLTQYAVLFLVLVPLKLSRRLPIASGTICGRDAITGQARGVTEGVSADLGDPWVLRKRPFFWLFCTMSGLEDSPTGQLSVKSSRRAGGRGGLRDPGGHRRREVSRQGQRWSPTQRLGHARHQRLAVGQRLVGERVLPWSPLTRCPAAAG